MSKPFRLAATACCLLLCIGVSEASAKAGPGYTVQPGSRFQFFHVQGTHGFDVGVYLFADETLRVELNELRHNAYAAYTAHASIVDHRVTARIAKLGSISMRFQPQGPVKTTPEPQGDCRGRKALIQEGVFIGHFRMRGERGFTEARTARVAGSAVHTFREVCKGSDAGPESRSNSETTLRARKEGRGRTVLFRASSRKFGGGGIEEFEGRLVEVHRHLAIERVVYSGEPMSGDFAFDRNIGSAAVFPVAPFAGSAVLNPPGEPGRSWDGDLSAKFLGVGRVPLSGLGFHATLTGRG